MGRLLRRLWYLLRARRVAADLEDELALHRSLLEADQIRQGARRADAATTAHRTLGSTALAADEVRDAVVSPTLRDIAQDVRFAVRMHDSSASMPLASCRCV